MTYLDRLLLDSLWLFVAQGGSVWIAFGGSGREGKEGEYLRHFVLYYLRELLISQFGFFVSDCEPLNEFISGIGDIDLYATENSKIHFNSCLLQSCSSVSLP